MENSKIEWCDNSFNAWRGCSKVNTGCKNCYALAMSKRNPGSLGVFGTEAQGGKRIVASEAMWKKPIKWNKLAEERNYRPRIFCDSMGDVFEDWQGQMLNHHGTQLFETTLGWMSGRFENQNIKPLTMNNCRRRLFSLIDNTANLDWLVLTKRPENIRRMWEQKSGEPLGEVIKRKNAWLGTSVADQATAEKAIPELLKCNDLAGKLFLSVEPLVGPVDFDRQCSDQCTGECGKEPYRLLTDNKGGFIDWVIVGGESGHHARPCGWIRSVVEQCESAGVPCFVKQLGKWIIDRNSTAACSFPDEECWPKGFVQDGQRIFLKDKKGGDIAEWPEDLRVRQFPEAAQ